MDNQNRVTGRNDVWVNFPETLRPTRYTRIEQTPAWGMGFDAGVRAVRIEEQGKQDELEERYNRGFDAGIDYVRKNSELIYDEEMEEEEDHNTFSDDNGGDLNEEDDTEETDYSHDYDDGYSDGYEDGQTVGYDEGLQERAEDNSYVEDERVVE